MVICNHLNEIIAINSSHGGAPHDSAVWNCSNEVEFLKQQFHAGEVSIRLLGDSGYPLQPWLLTPYRNATEGSAEIRFNNIHSAARSQIERTIGILKGRWRCLSNERKLRFDPETVTQIINVCCALHNACIHFRLPFIPNAISITSNTNNTQADVISNSNLNDNLSRIAQNIRNNIKNSL
ncbi:putative nuclease HARBI1 [Eupeodes corollae]|uniref:putative nuclease HARBI1 n=1 Tax=Eupeodes corollae TaxID=290404 RepID=UPI00249111A6|nr:putative nuclease HARBI1 [Eupeodes corollae]